MDPFDVDGVGAWPVAESVRAARIARHELVDCQFEVSDRLERQHRAGR
jgi:hypothetical protein